MKRAGRGAYAVGGRQSGKRRGGCGTSQCMISLLMGVAGVFVLIVSAANARTGPGDDVRRILSLRHETQRSGVSEGGAGLISGSSLRLPPAVVVLARPAAEEEAAINRDSSVMNDPLTDGGSAYAAGREEERGEDPKPSQSAAASASPSTVAAAAASSPAAPPPGSVAVPALLPLVAPRRTLLDEYRASHGRAFHTHTRVVPNAYKAGDGDVLLLQPEEDPMVGVAFIDPTTRSPSAGAAVEEARTAHEASAEVAIVVVSAPRLGEGLARDGVLPQYFRQHATCTAETGYSARAPACDAAAQGTPKGDAACRVSFARACDADPKCMGFDATGNLYHHTDAPTCQVSFFPTGDALSDPKVGLYTKSPMSGLPVPRELVSPAGPDGEGPPSPLHWWHAAKMDVFGYDLVAPPLGAIPEGDEAARVKALMEACAPREDCAGFTYPGGMLKKTTHVAQITALKAFSASRMAGVYSKTPIPPLDYLTATVVSFMEEMGDACDSGGAFGGKVHLYVYDTSRLGMHEGGGAGVPRGPEDPDYWFRSFAWLRRQYNGRPCVTFRAATAYQRLNEASPPAYGRGMPEWQADNRGRGLARGKVGQTLDFVSGIRDAAAASPLAHLMVWEDDCYACPATLARLDRMRTAVASFDPGWGVLKVGNGGSGMLFHSDLVGPLVTYLVTRRGSDNVDVAMWRFLHSGQFSDYLAKKTWSAHRGLQSSFHVGGTAWGRVECGNLLDYYWGWYNDCTAPEVKEAMRAAGGSWDVGAGDAGAKARADATRVSVLQKGTPVNGDPGLGELVEDWRCSVWSGGSVGIMKE